jgi:uncharacterized protein (UPF0332 family)
MDSEPAKEAEETGPAQAAADPEEGLQRVEADAERAVYALSVAMELIRSAEDEASRSQYRDSVDSARNSMRMAASALLFRDGYVATDLETSCSYLRRHYADIVPVDDWVAVEAMAHPKPFEQLGAIFSMAKSKPHDTAIRALEAAGRFVQAAAAAMMSTLEDGAEEPAEAG